jgi:hypothetical protein
MTMVRTKDRPWNDTRRPDMNGSILAPEVLADLVGEGIELSENLGEAKPVLWDRLMAVGA